MYYNSTLQLVQRTPRPLIDYPRTPELDIDEDTVAVCDDVCVAMNAHAMVAQVR